MELAGFALLPNTGASRNQPARPPSANAQIDWSNPITRGLWMVVHGNKKFKEEFSNIAFTDKTSVAYFQNKHGWGVEPSATAGRLQGNMRALDLNANQALTVLVGGQFNSFPAGGQRPFQFDHLYATVWPSSPAAINVFRADSTWTTSQYMYSASDTFTAGVPYTLAIRWAQWPSITNSAIWCNGADKTSTTNSGSGTLSTAQALTLGNEGSGFTLPVDGMVNFFCLWTRALSDDELRSITRNPNQIWKQPRKLAVATANLPAAAIAMPAFRRKTQPAVRVGVDRSNPLTRGLIRLYNFADGGRDACGKYRGTWGDTSPRELSRAGAGLRVTNYRVTNSTDTVSGELTTAMSAIVVAIRTGTMSSSNFLFGETGNQQTTDYNWGFYVGSGDGMSFYVRQDGSTVQFVSMVSSIWNGDYPFVGVTTWEGGTNIRFYNRNGVTQSAGTLAGPIQSTAYTVNSANWAGVVPDHLLLMGGVWDRRLSDAEAAILISNPWQLFAPQRRIIVPQPGAVVSRPVLNRSALGWAPSGGSDLVGAIDELSYDDADYIEATV